jgi:hypothetical protein
MSTAVAADAREPRPLYVLLLEEAVRELDRVISENGPPVHAENPEDHGLSPEVAQLVGRLRP